MSLTHSVTCNTFFTIIIFKSKFPAPVFMLNTIKTEESKQPEVLKVYLQRFGY